MVKYRSKLLEAVFKTVVDMYKAGTIGKQTIIHFEEICLTVCTCACYDKRGWSICGFPCEQHPPEGLCPSCKENKTHNNVDCITCAMENGDE